MVDSSMVMESSRRSAFEHQVRRSRGGVSCCKRVCMPVGV